MNRRTYYLHHFFALYIACGYTSTHAKTSSATLEAMRSIESLDSHKENDENSLIFSYTNIDLVDVITAIADKNKKNILLPQGANAIKAKLTYHNDTPLSPEQAWDLVVSFLDVAGYSAIDKTIEDMDVCTIVKTSNEIAREGLPVYIGADFDKAPDNDQRITYVHYFTNMKADLKGGSELEALLKAVLPADAKSIVDQNKNALIVAARQTDIATLLTVLKELDKAGFNEKIDFLKLRHTSASIVANLFNENILQQKDGYNRYRLDTRKKTESTYFATNTRMMPENRTNSLIIIGQEQAVERIKEFIRNYIDVELESGKSVLHVYRLQYLDANDFAPILEKVVASSDIGATGQARGGRDQQGGPERFFEEVIIAVDQPIEAAELKYYGGNNLIIACRNADWNKIKELIEELDKPQPQVFIEVLIADLTLEDSRLLGALTRNPDKIPLINLTQFQSAQLSPGVIVDSTTNPTTVAGDLLRASGDSGASDVLSNMEAGSTAISLNDNDGKTWSILQLLNLFTHSKILSHPHMVAINNKQAEIKVGEYRLVRGDVTASTSVNTVRKFEPFTADLTVRITPRISSAETVNLDVDIDIEEFLSTATDSPKATRTIKTNANVFSESILALGGLIRTASSQGLAETPVLSKVPILGWFFKKRTGDVRKNNLTVFISPTIVQPRLRKGIGTYTQDYINLAESYADESVLFDSLKQPITRLFFHTESTFDQELDKFISQDEFVTQEAVMPEPRISSTKKSAQNAHTQDKPAKIEQEQQTVALAFNEQEKSALLKELLQEEENPFMN